MRKVPILTAVSLATVFGLLVAPAGAATLYGSDTPGVIVAPGGDGSNVFNLNDFFDSTAGDISYSADGATVDADGNVSVASDASGVATFTATANGESVSVESQVVVSDFIIGGAPAIDNNNRWAGVPGGNPFVNGIAAGGSVSSVEALTGLPEPGTGGGSGTPGDVTGGGATGAAALVATIAQVDLEVGPSGLRSRNVTVLDSGAGMASANGLTATLNADGTYSIAADDTFAGAFIVGLGAESGSSMDVVSLLAAEAVDLDLSSMGAFAVIPAGANPLADVAFGANGIVVNAAAGQGALVALTAPIATGSDVTISANANASASVNVAVIAFDGALDASTVNFTNPSGSNIEAGATKNVAVSFTSQSGNVLPAVQVFNAGSSPATVTISSLQVIKAGPVTDYALNPNATAFANDGDASGWIQDILGSGAAAPAQASEGNFEGANGSIALNGVGGAANAAQSVAVSGGTFSAEAYVMRSGAADAGAAFKIVYTDAGATSAEGTVPGASISDSSWQKVSIATTISGDAAGFLVIQAAGFNAMVDDVVIRVVTDGDNLIDDQLLGL